MSFNSSKPDLYEQVTQALISALEEGAGEYRMPWHSLSQPVNAISHKAYRGINTLLLWAAAQKNGNMSPTSGPPTGNGRKSAARSAKASAARSSSSGNSSTPVRRKRRNTRRRQRSTPTSKRSRCMARAYHVFNAAQVDDVPAKSHEDLPESERIAHAEEFFAALPGTVIYEGESRLLLAVKRQHPHASLLQVQIRLRVLQCSCS